MYLGIHLAIKVIL